MKTIFKKFCGKKKITKEQRNKWVIKKKICKHKFTEEKRGRSMIVSGIIVEP